MVYCARQRRYVIGGGYASSHPAAYPNGGTCRLLRQRVPPYCRYEYTVDIRELCPIHLGVLLYTSIDSISYAILITYIRTQVVATVSASSAIAKLIATVPSTLREARRPTRDGGLSSCHGKDLSTVDSSSWLAQSSSWWWKECVHGIDLSTAQMLTKHLSEASKRRSYAQAPSGLSD
jgi:hypothetical protein